MRFLVLFLITLLAACSVDTRVISPEPDAGDAGTFPRTDSGADTGPRSDARGPRDTGTPSDSAVTPPTDASTDTGPAPDTAVPPAPTWTVIETLIVDSANAAPTFSTTVLAAGVTYRLRASGVVTNVIGTSQGDADWWDFSDPKDNGCCEDIGLGINDYVVDDLDTQPDWGPYDPTHVYEIDWVGDGNNIAALYQDTYYGNNMGDLTLEILALR